MKLKELFAVMVLYRHNFENFHWNSTGENFDDAHKDITTEYYEKINEDIDDVAEMLVRFGESPMNMKECLEFVENSDSQYLMAESAPLYTRAEIVRFSQTMLTDICKLIAETLESEEMKPAINAGRRSALEAILEYYDKQANFINKRRLIEKTAEVDVVVGVEGTETTPDNGLNTNPEDNTDGGESDADDADGYNTTSDF